MQVLQRTCHFARMNVQRIVARGFVILGGAFWAVVSLFSPYNPIPQWRDQGWITLGLLAATIAVFVLAMFYEQLAGLLLVGAGAAGIVYGLAMRWNGGEWALFGLTLIVPLFIGGALFMLAARMQNVCELSEVELRAPTSAAS